MHGERDTILTRAEVLVLGLSFCGKEKTEGKGGKKKKCSPDERSKEQTQKHSSRKKRYKKTCLKE